MLQYGVESVQAKLAPSATEERDRVWRRRVGRLKRRAWRRRLVNVFIVWQIVCVAAWLLPASWPVVRNLLPADGSGDVRAYMTLSDFAQGWSMYAPNPDTRDLWMDAKVTYRNGQVREWTMPRIKDMSYLRRYPMERMRQWMNSASNNPNLWFSIARFAARSCDTDPSNPPVFVLLREHVRITPPLGHAPTPPITRLLCKAEFGVKDIR